MSAIELYARHQPGYEERLARTVQQLSDAVAAHPGSIVLATSLGAEDMVLTDLIARHRLPIALATLDTGALHPQTIELMVRLEARYGLPLERHAPSAQAVLPFVREHGEQAMYRSLELRKACCDLRKLQPLQQLLAGRSAWIAGLRREQSENRAAVPAAETGSDGRVKFNPLADWSWADVWHHIRLHEVPYNPLHDAFMPSIGCAPCTRAIAVGEPFRAGRWWWEAPNAKECGLHAGEPSARIHALSTLQETS
ncbi:MAG: phosphoadenylyl-sulfate reductase [Rubrivivax sp.]|nr:phosphoadenylyl-sulfate reductase [Rubrivivax sp.]